VLDERVLASESNKLGTKQLKNVCKLNVSRRMAIRNWEGEDICLEFVELDV
jgi:hypothetical protein